MNLLDDFARECVLLERHREPDGAGGYVTEWQETISFLNYQYLNNSLEAKRAEKEGVTSVYTALVEQDVPIEYGDYYVDKTTGNTFRVTSNPEEKHTPKSSYMRFKTFSAERKALPI